MAKKSPWTDLDLNDPYMKRLASVGEHALSSGQVDPETAQSIAENMGIVPKKQQAGQLPLQPDVAAMGASSPEAANAMAMGVDPHGPTSPVSMQSPVDLFNQAGLNGFTKRKGAKVSSTQEAKTDTKHGVTQNTYLDDDSYRRQRLLSQGINPDTGVGDPNDPTQQQLQGVDQLKDLLRMEAEANSKRSTIDFSPLAALADSTLAQSGRPSNIAASIRPPEDRSKDFTQGALELQKRRSDIQKSAVENLKLLKSGTMTDQTSQNNMIRALAELANPGGGAMGALGELRRNKMAIDAGASFDKDPILKQIATTNNSLDRATSVMNGKTPVTGKTFALLQQDMISAMAPGGAATEGKVNREMVETLAGALNNLQTKFGNINDLRKEQPAVFAQLQGLIDQVKMDYNHAGLTRTQDLESNFKDIPEPMIQSTVGRKAGALKQRFAAPKHQAAGEVPAPSGKKALEEMSNEELKAFIAAGGKL